MSRSDPLRTLSDRIRPVTLARERAVPLHASLAGLVPAGSLQRGSTVLVTAEAGTIKGTNAASRPQGATTLAFALVAAASEAGSWCSAVGFPDLGAVAVAELGVDLGRLALIPRADPVQWVTVVGALLDAVDIVIARPPARLRGGDARRLIARARERRTVLIPVGSWPEGADLRLTVVGNRWEGLGAGDGHLCDRWLEVAVSGRGAAARPRHVEVQLPAGAPGRTDEQVPALAYAGSDADLLPEPAGTRVRGPLRTAG